MPWIKKLSQVGFSDQLFSASVVTNFQCFFQAMSNQDIELSIHSSENQEKMVSFQDTTFTLGASCSIDHSQIEVPGNVQVQFLTAIINVK